MPKFSYAFNPLAGDMGILAHPGDTTYVGTLAQMDANNTALDGDEWIVTSGDMVAALFDRVAAAWVYTGRQLGTPSLDTRFSQATATLIAARMSGAQTYRFEVTQDEDENGVWLVDSAGDMNQTTVSGGVDQDFTMNNVSYTSVRRNAAANVISSSKGEMVVVEIAAAGDECRLPDGTLGDGRWVAFANKSGFQLVLGFQGADQIEDAAFGATIPNGNVVYCVNNDVNRWLPVGSIV